MHAHVSEVRDTRGALGDGGQPRDDNGHEGYRSDRRVFVTSGGATHI